MGKLFIHATNIHQGGGKVLLDEIVKTNTFKGERVLLLDSRMLLTNQLSNTDCVKRVTPSVLQRFLGEWWLARQVQPDDTVLCFGNLPPIFKLLGHVVVFVQNRYLLENISLSKFAWKVRLRLHVERFWFRFKLGNVDQFIVQTPSMNVFMESLIKSKFAKGISKNQHEKGNQLVKVLPFIDSIERYERMIKVSSLKAGSEFDFVYVASGEPHKNHRRLIEAWLLLAESGVFPSLCLTLDTVHCSELTEWIDEMIHCYKLNIMNVGMLTKQDIVQLYGKSNALIYPSTLESFGLPLIEARQSGLAILASELDYVRDIIDPEQSFDPKSATSIARAVKRFKGVDVLPLPLLDAEEFMSHVQGQSN